MDSDYTNDVKIAPRVSSSLKSRIVNHYKAFQSVSDQSEESILDGDRRPLLQNHNNYQAINDVEVEQENLLETSQIVKTLHVYKRRWYILALFSLLAFLQGGLCNIWTVITPSVEEVFQWSDQDISIMQIWIYVAFLVSLFPMAIMVDMKGLRYPMIITGILLALGTGLRCLVFSPPYVLWISHVAHMIIGAAGPLTYTAGPIISALWFPANQRATATAISTIAGYAGGSACFLFGPMLVDAPQSLPINNLMITTLSNVSNVTSNIDVMRDQIRMCRLIEFGVCLLGLLLVVLYFPSKPPRSPTLSSAIGKLNLRKGLVNIFSKEQRNFWAVCMAYCICVGMYGVWNGLLGVNLKDLMSSSEIGWLGFVSIMTGCVTGVVLGRLSDLFTGRMKLFTSVMVAGFILSTIWFILLSHGFIQFSTPQIYAAGVLQGLFNNGAVPLYYELGIEATYPIAEICVATIMTFIYNSIPLFFIAIFFIPNIGTMWMDWLLLGAGLVSLPIILSFKELYKRAMVDKEGEKIQEEIISASANHQDS